MMYATKIRMQNGCRNSNNTQEIAEIYVDGCDNPGFFLKLHCMIISRLIRTVFKSIFLHIPVLFRQPVLLERNMFVLNQMILYTIIC